RVLHADTANRHPLGWCRQLGGIPPVEILCEMESELFAHHDEQLEVIEVPGGLALVPRAADIDHRAAAVCQHTVKRLGERPEPVDVFIRSDVAVFLLADQAEG